MIEKHKNVLSDFYLADLYDYISGPMFRWSHFGETASGYNGNYAWVEDENTEEIDLFTGHASKDSGPVSYEPLIYTISNIVGYKIEIERIKTNLLLPNNNTRKNSYNRPHVDYPENGMKTFLLYLNDSDGDTFLFDKIYNGQDPGRLQVIDRVTPNKNSAILFDSNRYHASSTPTTNKRFVINIVFWEPKIKQKYLEEQQKRLEVPFDPLPESFSGTYHIKTFFQKK